MTTHVHKAIVKKQVMIKFRVPPPEDSRTHPTKPLPASERSDLHCGLDGEFIAVHLSSSCCWTESWD